MTRKARQYTYAPAVYIYIHSRVPSCVWPLSRQLRNSTRSDRKCIARVKLSTLQSLARKQRTVTYQRGGQAEVKSTPLASVAKSTFAIYIYFHVHNIAPSRNGNHASNRWDFHSIPTLIIASFLDWLQPYLASTLYM